MFSPLNFDPYGLLMLNLYLDLVDLADLGVECEVQIWERCEMFTILVDFDTYLKECIEMV